MPHDLTHLIAAEVCGRTPDTLPESVWAVVRHCLLDTTGTAIAGAQEPFVQALRQELLDQGGRPESAVFGAAQALPSLSAALINGTAAHALDYDDVNFHMAAHPSVAILPAVLALGERLDATWADVAASFVAGYDAGCRIGRLLEPSHYRMGFHGTATIGTFAAAAACARLLRLSVEQTINAIGIAATQAAGIRAMFGTACKPLHAGKAAHNGLFAALMSARDFSSHPHALTAPAGFAVTHSHDLNLDLALAPAPNRGAFLHDNLFKYHAACYLTHAVADAAAMLRDELDASPEDVAELNLVVSTDLDTVCNIAAPRDGLQLKFSVCGVAALTLLRRDTSRLSEYNTDIVQDPAFTALLPRIHVVFEAGREKTVADVTLRLRTGRQASRRADSGIPMSDLDAQEARLKAKFSGLVSDALGDSACEALLRQYDALTPETPIRVWMKAGCHHA